MARMQRQETEPGLAFRASMPRPCCGDVDIRELARKPKDNNREKLSPAMDKGGEHQPEVAQRGHGALRKHTTSSKNNELYISNGG